MESCTSILKSPERLILDKCKNMALFSSEFRDNNSEYQSNDSLSSNSEYMSGATAVNTMEDPIIFQLLEKRSKMTDVDEEAEAERQRRMYIMLRHSRRYKKLQVANANNRWDADLDLLHAENPDPEGHGTNDMIPGISLNDSCTNLIKNSGSENNLCSLGDKRRLWQNNYSFNYSDEGMMIWIK